jgi:L-cystine transport system permease protein
MDAAFFLTALPKLAAALPLTLVITFAAMSAGFVLGILLTLGKISRFHRLASCLNVFTSVIRGIPTIVLLFLSYFGLPSLFLIFGIDINGWNKIMFAIFALVLEVAAVASELFRSAYLSLDKGQLDAAMSIGMNHFQRIRRVIIPQGLRVIIPNIGNLLISQFQNTALVYSLGIIDIIGKLNILDTLSFGAKTFELYIAAALLYWLTYVLFSAAFRLFEKQLNKGYLALR